MFAYTAFPCMQLSCMLCVYVTAGSMCAICPVGATCAGGFALPQAQAGYYPDSVDQFSQCYPASACVGDSAAPCAPGYAGVRCGSCADRHYRLQQLCKACPNTGWLLILGVFVIVLCLIGLSVFLTKKRINVAGMSIGVDFLQVCLSACVCVRAFDCF